MAKDKDSLDLADIDMAIKTLMDHYKELLQSVKQDGSTFGSALQRFSEIQERVNTQMKAYLDTVLEELES